jgi:hypothetical protein
MPKLAGFVVGVSVVHMRPLRAWEVPTDVPKTVHSSTFALGSKPRIFEDRNSKGQFRRPPWQVVDIVVDVADDVTLYRGLRTPGRRHHGPHRAAFDQHGLDAVLGQIHGTTSGRVAQKC